jgi:FAD/FMN-containing dehydrogenase
MPGHSTCDDGLVIDLRALNHVTVDPHARKAKVGGGALLGDLDRATQKHGLVVPAGVVSHTGVAGLTLGGGVGRLMRRFGLTIDSLLSAEVVTADGRILRTSKDQHPDLFCALRGGGGNFGVVTEFEFALHELSELLILATFHPLDQARKVIERGRQEMADPAAPDELLWTSFLRRANDVPWIPQELVGRHGIMSLVEWSGDPDEGRARLTEIRGDLAPAASDLSAVPCWLVNIPATWRDPADDEREIGWARATYAAIRPHLSEGSYVNFMGDDEDDTAAAAYGRTIERLQQVKARYDPDNTFRLNQNIKPHD